MPPKKYLTKISNKKKFKIRLYKIINIKEPLVLLANSINWTSFKIKFSKTYNLIIERPGINTRLMVSLHYLKYAYNLSDRAVLEFWIQNPYWQFFSGIQFFVHEMPINYSSMCRWRKQIGESGVEKLLKETIKTGLKLKIIKNDKFEDINVDTTVQEKYFRFPTDSRLYFRAIQRFVKLANKLNIKLRLKYINLSKHFLYSQTRYINTKQTEKVE